eukprot:5050852-Pleurochrysis_carterae.AAC.1
MNKKVERKRGEKRAGSDLEREVLERELGGHGKRLRAWAILRLEERRFRIDALSERDAATRQFRKAVVRVHGIRNTAEYAGRVLIDVACSQPVAARQPRSRCDVHATTVGVIKGAVVRKRRRRGEHAEAPS